MKDPDCIKLLSGRLAHQLILDLCGYSVIFEVCAAGVVESLSVENSEFLTIKRDLIGNILLRARKGFRLRCQIFFPSQVIDNGALS